MTETENYKDRIVYNLHECQAGRLATWEIKEQRTSDELVLNGGPDGSPPRVTFELTPLGFNGLRGGSEKLGTEVRLAFEYASVTKRSGGWWFAADQTAEFEKRFLAVGAAWAMEMRKRGYQPAKLVPPLDLTMAMSRPPQVEVPTHRDDSDRSTAASEASGESPSTRARPMVAAQKTERATSGQRLTARSKPFWQLEQERTERAERAERTERTERTEKQTQQTQQELATQSPPPQSTWPPTGQYGLRTFKVEEQGQLGIALQESQRKRWRGSSHLTVVRVVPGSLADRLGVPVGGILTGLNGRALAPGIPHKQQLMSALERPARPVFISFYLEPPKGTTGRPSMRRSVLRLLSGKPYRSAAAADPDVIKEKPKPPSETPSTTNRSGSSSETEAYVDDLMDEMSA